MARPCRGRPRASGRRRGAGRALALARDDPALTALDDVVARLEACGRFGIKPGLERTRALLDRLGSPDAELRGVLVAGTNGKGSVCATLESMARAAGRSTALLAKPHLVHWGERIVLDGAVMSDDDFAALAGDVLDTAALLDDHPTQFEVLTAAGILAAARHGAETVVCEVGMGGRLDSTNVLDLGACVITNVALDHQEWLGETVEEIAAEKAGILKAGDRAVSAATPPARTVLALHAREAGATLDFVERDRFWHPVTDDAEGVGIRLFDGLTLRSPLLGAHQMENLALAAAAARLLGIGDEALVAGAATASWPGRLQWIDGTPPLLLDAAHNPAGMEALAAAVPGLAAGRRIVAVFGVMADKPVEAMLRTLRAITPDCVFTQPSTERAEPAARLAERFAGGEAADEIGAALGRARERAGAEGLVLVCGSLALVGEVLASAERGLG